jgi:hypothetical protein
MNVTILSYDLGEPTGPVKSPVLPHRGGFSAECLNRSKNIRATTAEEARAECARRYRWIRFDRACS